MPTAPTVHDVARYILVRQDRSAEPITNKKLQKLVYLAQGTALAMLHRSLWDTSDLGARVTAWEQGPVVPDLYRTYRAHRWNVLPVPGDDRAWAIDSVGRAMIDTVLETYGGMTADQLAALTHDHDPWKKAWSRAQANSNDDVISEPEMVAFFTAILAGSGDSRAANADEIAAAMKSSPKWVAEDVRSAAEIAAGKGMNLGELRRSLDL